MRGESVELSEYQKKIIDFYIEHPFSNMYINALAGSGKTHTILELTKLSETSDVYLAFNNSVVNEFKEKITNDKVKVSTTYAMAFSIMKYNMAEDAKAVKAAKGLSMPGRNPEPVVDGWKVNNIVSELIDRFKGRRISFVYKTFLQRNYASLYSLCRLTVTSLSNRKAISKLCLDHNLFVSTADEEITPTIEEVVDWLGRINKRSIEMFEEEQKLDFTDMLFITCRNLISGDWSMPPWARFTNIFVEEAQDMNNLQLMFIKFLKKKNSRYVFILDEHQAIYAFNGANANAFRKIKESFAPIEEFDLPICYRCPQSVIDKVNEEFSIPIKAMPGVIEGHIKNIKKSEIPDYAKAGDMVISRKNSWLSDVIINLAVHNVPVYIEDKELVKAVQTMVSSNKATKAEVLRQTLLKKVKNYRASVRDALNFERDDLTTDEQMARAEEAMMATTMIDNIVFVLEILRIYLKKHPSASKLEFEKYLREILNTTPSPKCVRVCSIHKAKGLEADNVFVLNEGKSLYSPLNSYEQNQQERNLSYIAFTRAKKNLYLVESEADG